MAAPSEKSKTANKCIFDSGCFDQVFATIACSGANALLRCGCISNASLVKERRS
jgi:hypothetical protein